MDTKVIKKRVNLFQIEKKAEKAASEALKFKKTVNAIMTSSAIVKVITAKTINDELEKIEKFVVAANTIKHIITMANGIPTEKDTREILEKIKLMVEISIKIAQPQSIVNDDIKRKLAKFSQEIIIGSLNNKDVREIYEGTAQLELEK